MTAVRLHFVGTGDAFGNGGRLQTCFWLEGGGESLLIDCGATSLVALKAAAIVLQILALLSLIGSVFLARDRRRGLLRAGIGLAVSMLLLIAALAVGRSLYLHIRRGGRTKGTFRIGRASGACGLTSRRLRYMPLRRWSTGTYDYWFSNTSRFRKSRTLYGYRIDIYRRLR